MDQFVENDPNIDRSSKARRGVIDALFTYLQILTECKRKKRTTLDATWQKGRKLETQNRLNDLTDLEFYLFL